MSPLTLRSRSAFDCASICIYLYSFLSVFSFAVVIFAVIYKVEYIVSGTHAFKASHQSVFILNTANFINSACRVVFTKYLSRLSDYVGRKPLLFMATFSALIRTFIIYEATTPGEIYFAAFLYGTFDLSLPIAQAWICDVVTNPSRGAALGMNAGIGFGLAFAIGIPIGTALPAAQGTQGVNTCFYLSFCISIVGCLYVAFLPIDDTLGVLSQEEEEEAKKALENRENGIVSNDNSDHDLEKNDTRAHSKALDTIPMSMASSSSSGATQRSRRCPSDITAFMRANQPFSSFPLIMKAVENPWDFLSYFWAQAAQQVLTVNFLLFLSAAYNLGPATSGAILAFIGIAVAFWSPLLLSKYKDRGISMACMLLAAISYLWFSITGLPQNMIGNSGQYQAYPIYLLISISGTWISGMPSIITKQYAVEQQGECLGVLAVVAELSNIPAYGVGVLFSFLISPLSTFYWPGAIWMCAAAFFMVALMIQYYTSPQNGWHLITLIPNDKHEMNTDDGELDSERNGTGVVNDNSKLELNNVYSNTIDVNRRSADVRYSDTRNPLSVHTME